MQDSITTNLDINILDAPDVPATGFLTDTTSNGGGEAVPIVAISILLVVIALFVVFMIVKRKRTPKFHSPLRKNVMNVVKLSAIMLVFACFAFVSALPRSVDAAEKLITVSLTEQPGVVEAARGDELKGAATLAISMETESLNDLELEVSFENKNSGIVLSAANATLAAGTTEATVPIDMSISEAIDAGKYTEQIELTVKIKEGFWRTEGRDVVNPQGIVTLLNAMNVSTSTAIWYDDSVPNLDRVMVQHNDFTYSELENLGVNAVRFDFPARVIADDCTTSACLNYDYSEEIFEMFDEVLTHASNHNIGVIFNIHNAYGTAHPRDGSGPAYAKWDTFLPDNIEKTTALWEKIASRFVDDKRVLGFDIMNEPMIRLESTETASDAIAKWDTVAQNMIDRIRAVDGNHMIIVEKANRGLKNNGNSEVNLGESYVFANVTDPQENLMHEFHHYGNWSYVTQSDDEVENDPWVWPSTEYVGVIKEFASVNSGTEVWPPARYTAGTDAADTWVTVESNNGVPAAIAATDPQWNLGNVQIITSSSVLLEADSAYYIDNIVVDQYDADGNFEKTVYTQDFKFAEAFSSKTAGAVSSVETDQSKCYDDVGGCYKISGPSTASYNFATAWERRRFFPIDANKKYKISAKVYAENVPAGATMRVMLSYSYGSEEQVQPYTKAYLKGTIQKYIDYAEENNVPIFNGEYGVLKNGEVWDKIGGAQFVSDSMEVYQENNVNAAYFSYYDWNTNSRERRSGLRVREYAVSTTLPIDGTESVLNTALYNVFLEHKK